MWVLPNILIEEFNAEITPRGEEEAQLIDVGLFHRDKTRTKTHWDRLFRENPHWTQYLTDHLVADTDTITTRIVESLPSRPKTHRSSKGKSVLDKYKTRTTQRGKVITPVEQFKDKMLKYILDLEKIELAERRCRADMFMVYSVETRPFKMSPLSISFDLEIDFDLRANGDEYDVFEGVATQPELKSLKEIRGSFDNSWLTPVAHLGEIGSYGLISKISHYNLTDDVLDDHWSYAKDQHCLNPRWVEAMMGVPIGMTQPSAKVLTEVKEATQTCTEAHKDILSWVKKFLKDNKFYNKKRGCN